MVALLDNSFVKFALLMAAIFVVMNILKSFTEGMDLKEEEEPAENIELEELPEEEEEDLDELEPAQAGDHAELPDDFAGEDADLQPEELLPEDRSASMFVANNEITQNLADKNFLVAGNHVGTNSIGTSLRNANLQLRSDPPNPSQPTGPWLQSTITPDQIRKTFEIGEC